MLAPFYAWIPSLAPPAPFWQGKRCLLTGASSGLGEALAHELTKRGATLVLCARRAERLEAVARACGGGSKVLPMDVAAGDTVVEAKASEALELLGGRCDVLLCAAGVGQRTDAAATSAADHRAIMAANFEGPVALTRVLLPPMLARGAGSIAVVTSVQGRFGQPFRSSYAASKAAAIGYFDSLRAEVASRGLGVTVVSPGYIATDHASSALGGDGAADANANAGMPPAELAALIADAVAEGRAELVAAPLDARAAIVLRALWPAAVFKLMERKAAKPKGA